jgi:hypothetical protein
MTKKLCFCEYGEAGREMADRMMTLLQELSADDDNDAEVKAT